MRANGYTFDGHHTSEYNLTVTGRKIPYTPEIKNLTEDMGGRDGQWDFGVQYGTKMITFDHYVSLSTRPDVIANMRALIGLLNPRKGARPLISDSEPDKMYYARVSDKIEPGSVIGVYEDFSLNFICYDPFTYSVTEYTPTITTIGTINHLGTHVSKPTLVIDHKGGSATITIVRPNAANQTIVFGALTAPGIYTIDCKEGTVKLGAASGEQYIDSAQFFEMTPGINTISHTANINNIVVKYRNTWL